MSEALLKAVRILGSRASLANAIGTIPEVVKSWLNVGIRVPLEFAFEIQRVTNGQVTWQEISPHLARFQKGWVSTNVIAENILPQLIKQISLSRISIESTTHNHTEEIYALSIDIKKHGLQRAICIDTENQLIFGKKRFLAHQLLGKKSIACWKLSLIELIKGNYSVTELCKNFTWSERIAIAFVIEKLLGNRQGQRSDLELRQNFDEVQGKVGAYITKGRTHTLIANHLGFGNRVTYTQSKKIYLQGSDALIHLIDNQKISIYGAFTLLHLSHEEQITALNHQKKDLKLLLQHLKKHKQLHACNTLQPMD